MSELLDFYRMTDTCGEPPIFTGYGLGVLDFEPALFSGKVAWGHTGSISGYRTLVAHLPDLGVTMAFMTNTDTDDAAGLVDPFVKVILNYLGEPSSDLPPVNIQPGSHAPKGVPVFDTFQKEALFCDHNPQWVLQTSTEDWINLSLEWVVGADSTKAEQAWDKHSHSITINGTQILDLERYTHDITHYKVACPEETLDIWAKGLSIYIPPLPAGKYQIQWNSQITDQFNNGWVTYQPGDFMEINAVLTIE
jgi:hypothetical protein